MYEHTTSDCKSMFSGLYGNGWFEVTFFKIIYYLYLALPASRLILWNMLKPKMFVNKFSWLAHYCSLNPLTESKTAVWQVTEDMEKFSPVFCSFCKVIGPCHSYAGIYTTCLDGTQTISFWIRQQFVNCEQQLAHADICGYISYQIQFAVGTHRYIPDCIMHTQIHSWLPLGIPPPQYEDHQRME